MESGKSEHSREPTDGENYLDRPKVTLFKVDSEEKESSNGLERGENEVAMVSKSSILIIKR